MTRPLLDATAEALGRIMDHASRRHTVLASNVANADTPGYLPVDIPFTQELNKAIGTQSTDTRHIGPSLAAEEAVFDVQSVPDKDGNAVDIDREMAKLAENGQRYMISSQTLSKKLAMLRYAIESERGS
jgi:flagellar basal-body rod protein FlgB